MEKLYGEAIQAYFDQHNIELKKLIFSGNETDKHISVVEKILVALKKNRASRNQPVLVVGGGVIADVTGCATALYHRNTPYVMVCTSVVTGIDAGPSPRRGCDGFGFKISVRCIPPTCDYLHRQILLQDPPPWLGASWDR